MPSGFRPTRLVPSERFEIISDERGFNWQSPAKHRNRNQASHPRSAQTAHVRHLPLWRAECTRNPSRYFNWLKDIHGSTASSVAHDSITSSVMICKRRATPFAVELRLGT